MRLVLLYCALGFLLLASWAIPDIASVQIYPKEDFLFLIDVFSGMTGATCIFVTLYITRRDGYRAAFPALCGVMLFLLPALSAPGVFTPIDPSATLSALSRGHLTAALTDLGLVGTVRLSSVIQHWLVGLAIALVLTIGALSGAFASALQVVRTVFFQLLSSLRDVIAAVPALVVALFFFLLLSDVWYAVGQLSSQRLAAVLFLLGLITALFVVDITRREVGALIASQVTDETHLASDMSGIRPRWRCSARIRADLWVQMGVPTLLRVLLAGGFLAVLLGLAAALLTSSVMLSDWLHRPPHVIADGSIMGAQLFFTREGLAVAALLGAFAGLAYAATALEEGTNRDRLLGRVRQELTDGLTLGAYYNGALESGWWRSVDGTRWPYPRAFLLEEHSRRDVRPVPLGNWFDDQGTQPGLGPLRWHAMWSALWFSSSNELVAIRMTPYPTEVRLLGHFDDETSARSAIGPPSDIGSVLPFSGLIRHLEARKLQVPVSAAP